MIKCRCEKNGEKCKGAFVLPATFHEWKGIKVASQIAVTCADDKEHIFYQKQV